MTGKTIITSCICFLSFILITGKGFAQVKKDTLFFTNNEILIGELKGMSQGLITFKSDAVGTLSVKAYRINSVHTTMSTLRIETVDKEWLFGTLVPANHRDSIYVVDGLRRVKLALTDISSVLPFKKGFFDQLNGKLSAGFSFSHSSSIGQFNVNANIVHTTRWLTSELTVSELGSIDSAGFSRDQEGVQLSSYHFIKSSSWFSVASVSYQRNKELSLDHRFQGMGGFGNKFVSEQYIELMALSGISANQEKSIAGVTSNLLAEIPVVLKIDYFKFKHPNMQIGMTNAAYVSLSQWGRIRYDGNITFAWELLPDFDFTNNLYGNFDSRPTDVGSGKIDYGIVMGITYKF
ncbi:DUF481 domain-containing protein [Mucilaginibacter sp. AW1-3]